MGSGEAPKFVEPKRTVFTVFLEHPLTSNDCYWGTQGKYLTLRHYDINARSKEEANKKALNKGIKCNQCHTPYQIP